ncbi:hypothetical protein [Streptomyces sp. NPDC058595]|uniref:hypothetical protein n=1 Tax=Streptomyces sp. NPDC058595 TaxID=3346550 RepID=UPI0036497D95
MVRGKLRTTAGRGRAYDIARHQQAPTPEDLLAPAAAEPEHDDQGPEAGRGEAGDLTALRVSPAEARVRPRPCHTALTTFW